MLPRRRRLHLPSLQPLVLEARRPEAACAGTAPLEDHWPAPLGPGHHEMKLWLTHPFLHAPEGLRPLELQKHYHPSPPFLSESLGKGP